MRAFFRMQIDDIYQWEVPTMDREKFLTRFLPLVGGKENTSLCEFQD